MSRATQWLALALVALVVALLVVVELAAGGAQRWLWCANWLLVPFLAVALQRRWRPRWQGASAAPRRLWIGCSVFLLAFALLAWSGARPVRLEGHDRLPRNWLGLGELGDWRYLVGAGRGSGDAPEIAVITLSSGLAGEESPFVRERRWVVASVLAGLAETEAEMAALDFHFSEELTGPAVRVIDQELCRFVRDFTRSGATSRSLVYGLGFDESRAPVDVLPTVERLRAADCLGGSGVSQGHLDSYRGAGGVTRAIPLYFRAEARWPALALQVLAGRRTGDGEALRAHRPGGLLHFVRPRHGLVCLGGESIERNEGLRALCSRRERWDQMSERERQAALRERIVLVGDEVGDDHRTPYGTLPGVFVHAMAVHSLLEGRVVRHVPWSAGLVAVIALSLLLALRLGQRAGPGELLALAGVVIGLQALIAALAMALSLVWIELDVSSVGGGAATLLAVGTAVWMRRSARRRAGAESEAEGAGSPAADGAPPTEPVAATSSGSAAPVFVSFAHEDKAWLQRLLQMLRPLERQGLVEVWSDEEIRAGDQWRPAIARSLDEARIAVLLVSPAFLASDFIAHDELPPLLAASRERGLRLLCVHVSASLWEESPIADYQAAHDPSKPLDTMRRGQQNTVLKKVAARVSEAARE
ncbi:MAG TPA: CHASE2 domain-containing protein [Thermoanaerobaculia bacterium]|nr:CHASE2 domain-containing protein [Thermoanaerobaculia bacterium]